jgi:hypothetical protein
MANNIVYVSEADTNTSVAFKPSEFRFAEIGPKEGIPTGITSPHVLIWIADAISPSNGTGIYSASYFLILGATGMTAMQAKTALESVYTAVDAYYTSLVS